MLPKDIKGVMTDIGGVLYVGEVAIPDTPQTLNLIRKHYPLRLITNTTRITPESIIKNMEIMGFEIHKEEMYTALAATKDYVKSQGYTVYSVLTDQATVYFSELAGTNPSCVVVGDAHTNFDFEHINTAFRHLEKGAALVATSNSRYFKDSDGKLTVGAGGFVTALEFASGKLAKIIGKPENSFFHLVAASMGLPPQEILMIGDDIVSDIGGAQEAGMMTALVKTGKFKAEDLTCGIKPDIVLEDFNGLREYLGLESF